MQVLQAFLLRKTVLQLGFTMEIDQCKNFWQNIIIALSTDGA